MAQQYFGKAYGGNPPANYERFFVPGLLANTPVIENVDVLAAKPS